MQREFANGFGWCLAWLGFLGGIALIVWAYNANQRPQLDPQVVCIQEHGSWEVMPKKNWLYTCNFKEKK